MKVSEIKKLINVEQFFSDIERTKIDFECSYLDAIVHCCERNNIEIDVAAALIKSNPKMKAKVFDCSHLLKMVKNESV